MKTRFFYQFPLSHHVVQTVDINTPHGNGPNLPEFIRVLVLPRTVEIITASHFELSFFDSVIPAYPRGYQGGVFERTYVRRFFDGDSSAIGENARVCHIYVRHAIGF